MTDIKILGVKINNVDYRTTIEKIEEFIKSQKPHQICTINPEYIMAAQKDPEFKQILNQADLCIPDGTGLILASRFLAKSKSQIIKKRVTGVDLIWKLAELGQKKSYSIYLLGAGPGIAEQTANILCNKYPELKIAGFSEGIPQLPRNRKIILDLDRFEKELVSKICKLKPQILLVAYGAPKQDKFIAKYKKELAVPVMIGVGGSFDFISGRIKRAPQWMQKTHLEWLYRLFREPKRINRIITATIRFPIAVIRQVLEKMIK